MRSLKTIQERHRLIAEERQEAINKDFAELLAELTELGNLTKPENYSPSGFKESAHKFAELFTHWSTVVMDEKMFPRESY